MTDHEQLADELAEFDSAEREEREREADREALRNHQAGICGKKCPVCERRGD